MGRVREWQPDSPGYRRPRVALAAAWRVARRIFRHDRSEQVRLGGPAGSCARGDASSLSGRTNRRVGERDVGGIRNLVCVLGGKLDNVYDLHEELANYI